ncbi:MAG: PAS domain S-box protein, partial [bacterium]
MTDSPLAAPATSELHRAILERLSVGVAVVRPSDGCILYTNAAFARMLGYEGGELAGQPVSILNAPVETSPEARAQEIMTVLRERGTWSGEVPNRHKSGAVVWCRAAVRTVDDPAWGTVWLSEHVDVSEERRIADALTESEARLQSIVDNTTAVIYVKDLNGRYVVVNRRFEELFHVSRELAQGRTDHDIFPAAAAEVFRANDLAVARSGQPLEFDEVAPQDDGDHNYISIKFPLLRATGEVYATCGISTDISERTRAREVLQRANELLEQRVADRTAELSDANQRLQDEIAEHHRTEERNALLMSELDHRVKNVLATVVALADETFEKTESLETFRATFMGRIRTMARSHEALARAQWRGVDIAEAASLVLAPFQAASPGRLQVEGGSVRLGAAAALPICLALHELGTNAIKYGALGAASGRLHVSWRTAPSGRLALDWVEQGGPPVATPASLGSGLQIVRDLLETQLGASVAMRFAPDGFRCHLEIPLPTQPRNATPDPGIKLVEP